MSNQQISSQQVISLWAKEDSELSIQQGQVWATVGTGGGDADDDYGDHFLSAGQTMRVLKGQNLVFESMQKGSAVSYELHALQTCAA